MTTATHRPGSRAVVGLAFVLACTVAGRAQPSGAPQDPIRIHTLRLDDAILDYRRSLAQRVPPARGFRAPILQAAGIPWPMELSDGAMSPPQRQAADLVAQRLARDGLLFTTARAIELLGSAAFVRAEHSAMQDLRAVGLPTDLLAFFPPPDDTTRNPQAMVRLIAQRLVAGQSPAELRPFLDTIPFRFSRSHTSYRVACESGRHQIGSLRFQLPQPDTWRGPGDGSAVDLARQLVEALPAASFMVHIQETHLAEFLPLARQWPLSRPAQLHVLPEPAPVSQWAQDNGKPGLVQDRRAGMSTLATLVPRYASRGEERSIFAPGEAFTADSLAATGHLVVQSPLLFQGGNLLPVHDPATQQRLLLIGEAEVYRNTALGLSRDQVLDTFRIEFAVDRCVVLSAVSFHIDFELCVRAHEGRLLAFANDTNAAVRIILSLGVEALEAQGTLDPQTALTARSHLQDRRDSDFVNLVGGAVARRADKNGHYPESLTRPFAAGPVDAPMANFQRFLLAMDILAASVVGPDDMPADPFVAAFIRSLKRQAADRRALHRQIERLGWKVVPVPSLANAERSINYINGIHDRTRYFIPAYGGFYERLDRAAADAFRRELGPDVAVVPILSGESQRRLGALHCAVCVYPRPDDLGTDPRPSP